MTIFGFNTDVKHSSIVYHVQSEARQSDLLVQTLVFMKGQCIGKRTSSYAQKVSQPDFSDQAVHELLKAQHKAVIQAINDGNLESVLGTSTEIHDIGGDSGLTLKWLRAESNGADESITMYFQVTDSGQAVRAAQVVSRAGSAAGATILASGATDGEGKVQMRIPISEELRRESAITVQASVGDRSATRKFRFRKIEPKTSG